MALLTLKALASELSVSWDTVWRAYRKGEVPGEWIRNVLRFDLELVRTAMRSRDSDVTGRPRALGGDSRRRGEPKAPAW